MKSKYKVAYATGSRADYGIVRRYLKKLHSMNEIELSLLVTGSHLEEKYGKSIEIIVNDGFTIGVKVPLNIDNSCNAGILHSMAVAMDLFGQHFEDNKYDLLIILGDRYEMMSVAIAASVQRIPILHLHGGEATYANYDEFIRHSITKMSRYHFASTEKYKNRIIQLGENPIRVFNMGALGAENCKYIDEREVRKEITKLPKRNYYVIAFHPETLANVSLLEQVQEVQDAIDSFPDKKFVFIGTNADTGSDTIREQWMSYANSHENAYYIENLDTNSYLYMVKQSIAIVGNSSSGIIEAPSLGVCTVNIGHRQDGRISGNSVFHVECISSEIVTAMKEAEDFIKKGKTVVNPYYKSNTSNNYGEITLEILQGKYGSNASTIKTFYDIT